MFTCRSCRCPAEASVGDARVAVEDGCQRREVQHDERQEVVARLLPLRAELVEHDALLEPNVLRVRLHFEQHYLCAMGEFLKQNAFFRRLLVAAR